MFIIDHYLRMLLVTVGFFSFGAFILLYLIIGCSISSTLLESGELTLGGKLILLAIVMNLFIYILNFKMFWKDFKRS